jgi:hypothetical protein
MTATTALTTVGESWCVKLRQMDGPETRAAFLAGRIESLDASSQVEVLRAVLKCEGIWTAKQRTSLEQYVSRLILPTQTGPSRPQLGNPTGPRPTPTTTTPTTTHDSKDPMKPCTCDETSGSTSTLTTDQCGGINTPDMDPPVMTRVCGSCDPQHPSGLVREPFRVTIAAGGTFTVNIYPSFDAYLGAIQCAQGGILSADNLFISSWGVSGSNQMYPLPGGQSTPNADPNLTLIPISQFIEGQGENATSPLHRRQTLIPGPVTSKLLNSTNYAAFVVTNTYILAQTITLIRWMRYTGN